VQFSTNGLTLLSLLHKSHKACPFSVRTQFDFEFSGLRVTAAGEKANFAMKLLHDDRTARTADVESCARTFLASNSMPSRAEMVRLPIDVASSHVTTYRLIYTTEFGVTSYCR
jgi:hypothetical protein